MAPDPSRMKAAREELYRRIMRHLDLRGIPFDQAGRELGLTEKQIEILKREHGLSKTGGASDESPTG